MIDELYGELMRGVLADASIQKLVGSGILLDQSGIGRSAPDPMTTLLERFSSRVVTSARKMIPVYAVFYAFENTVREFVVDTMADAYGESWWDKVPARIRASVDSRKKQLRKHRWYSFAPASDIAQCLFGDLANIISDQWPLFESFFPSQDWMRVRLSELEMMRNAVAHANELPDEEIDRLNRYCSDWLKQAPT